MPGHVLLGRLLHLTCPGSLHAVGRHQHPGVPQGVVAQVLVLWVDRQIEGLKVDKEAVVMK